MKEWIDSASVLTQIGSLAATHSLPTSWKWAIEIYYIYLFLTK